MHLIWYVWSITFVYRISYCSFLSLLIINHIGIFLYSLISRNKNCSNKNKRCGLCFTECTTGWSTWINDNNPATGTFNGDKEISGAEYQKHAQVCVGGEIDRIECYSVDMDVPSYSSGEILTCTVDNGLECSNKLNDPIPCSDYKIRYHCLCSANSTGIVVYLLCFITAHF